MRKSAQRPPEYGETEDAERRCNLNSDRIRTHIQKYDLWLPTTRPSRRERRPARQGIQLQCRCPPDALWLHRGQRVDRDPKRAADMANDIAFLPTQ